MVTIIDECASIVGSNSTVIILMLLLPYTPASLYVLLNGVPFFSKLYLFWNQRATGFQWKYGKW